MNSRLCRAFGRAAPTEATESLSRWLALKQEPCHTSTAYRQAQPNRQQVSTSTITDNGTIYSVASSTGAGAGNRYEETVYALPGTNPCVAVRYFIHYGVIENYPAGTVQAFNQPALLATFDAIRRTLVIVQ